MSSRAPRFVLSASLVLACADAPATPATTSAGTTTTTTGTPDGSSTGGAPATTSSTGDALPTSATSGDGGTGSAGEATGTTTGADPFVLDCHTEFTAEQRLALACNLPRTLAACQRLGAPAVVCEDVDLDGLTDAWEDLALDLLHPLRRLDEAEKLIGDPSVVLADVGRVAPVGERVRVFIMIGYSKDYGSCGGFTGHNGDSERAVLDMQPDATRGAGGVVVVGAYTAAHEGTVSDHGQVFTGADLGMLVFAVDKVTADPRWVVFPSADKHATYASVPICEGVSPIPCIDEDCGPDDVDDPAAYERLPDVANAGEEAAPRLTDLTPLGFPDEDAWADQDFCGGLGGTGCASSVRSKLLDDPF